MGKLPNRHVGEFGWVYENGVGCVKLWNR